MLLWIALLVLMLLVAALPAFTMLLEYHHTSSHDQAADSRGES